MNFFNRRLKKSTKSRKKKNTPWGGLPKWIELVRLYHVHILEPWETLISIVGLKKHFQILSFEEQACHRALDPQSFSLL